MRRGGLLQPRDETHFNIINARTAPSVVRGMATRRRRCRESDVVVSRGEMRGARARERRHGDVRRALVETDWKGSRERRGLNHAVGMAATIASGWGG